MQRIECSLKKTKTVCVLPAYFEQYYVIVVMFVTIDDVNNFQDNGGSGKWRLYVTQSV